MLACNGQHNFAPFKRGGHGCRLPAFPRGRERTADANWLAGGRAASFVVCSFRPLFSVDQETFRRSLLSPEATQAFSPMTAVKACLSRVMDKEM
jgi:hypothetical protein